MVFILFLIDLVYHVDCFANIEPPLHFKNKSYLIMVNDFFNVLLDWFATYYIVLKLSD